MSISAFIPVFNEVKRIRYALTSIQWCDEIVVLDKTSTDRTVEIAKEFGAKVFVIPNSYAYDVTKESDYLFKYCNSDWVLLFTASDIMDIGLANELKRLTTLNDFDYDIIDVPYKRYVLGIENRRSPWHGNYHTSVFRKSVLKIRKDDVHGAISFESNRRYRIRLGNVAIHHLTHETVDLMMDHHLRYWRAEGVNFNDTYMKNAFRDILRAFKHVFIVRKTYFLGWDGVALICAYLSYAMMSFVYKWEKSNNNANKIYEHIRNKSMMNWLKSKNNTEADN